METRTLEPGPFRAGDLVEWKAGSLSYLARVEDETAEAVVLEILHAIAFAKDGERFFFPAPARERRFVPLPGNDVIRLIDPVPPARSSPVV